MSVELTHAGKRYMVDGGKWYRRLKVGEARTAGYQYNESIKWVDGLESRVGFPAYDRDTQYRVPCVDPRPPFKVGDRVKVARKDEGCWVGAMDPCLGEVETIKSILGDGGCLLSSGYAFFPQCLDIIEPAKPETKETAMKFSQWQLRPVKEPKTLADVESSRERPVLCWSQCGGFVAPMWAVGRVAWRETRRLKVIQCNGLPEELELFNPPPIAPAYTLETLPDYRVVIDEALKGGEKYWWFRLNGQWYWHGGESNDHFSISLSAKPSTDFTVTPYEVYLAEVDLAGGAK